MVVKRSGQSQPFDRGKIVAGVRAAAKNRPVDPKQMDALALDVEESLRLEGHDVTSQQVGRAVLEQLRALDEVAYVRFASVYKGFSDAGDFEREIGLLTKSTDPKHQP
jgi:transcriptional repressor NrdR